MFVRLSVASLFLTGAIAFAAPVAAVADEPLCKPGHVLDSSRQLCYDPAAAYRPNVPAQQPLFGGTSSSAPTKAAPTTSGGATAATAPASSGGGFFGWLSDQARFCRYGDRQVGNGDSAYCVARDGKTYPAGK